jgi:peroxiredoxin
MNLNLIQVLALALLAAPTLAARGQEMEGSAKIDGNSIAVRVRYKDGRPAAAVQVRLIDAGRLTVAASRTNDSGRWSTTVRAPGRYEVSVESERPGEKNLSLPCTVLGDRETKSIPWSLVFLGMACCLGAALLYFAGVQKNSGIFLLLATGLVLLGWSARAVWFMPTASAGSSGPDIAGEAREFLRSKKVSPLSEPLVKLLEEDGEQRVATDRNPLLGKAAPDFELFDHHETAWKLHERLKNGPLVLVFYYGYHCNHCVGQLFALHDDIAKFHELGADVVAISADPPELTRKCFKKYGDFAFPVLSDPGNKIAQAYGVFRPASGTMLENLKHGTFVIGRDEIIHWLQVGDEPFTGNRTLLYELARLEGRLPVASSKERHPLR